MHKTFIHVLPAFHYDIAYCKTFQEYLPAALAATRAAVQLLRKNTDYTFCIEQVALLREYWQKHPADRRHLRELARQGRLVVAPGMLTMPDSNIPSGESFIRNALLGRNWLQQHLGITPDCCWMADIFGHNPQSPQLAKTCGYASYMFERGKRGGWDTTFQWRGLDGTLINAQWEIDTYYGINLALSWRKDRPYKRVHQRLYDLVITPLQTHSPDPQTLLTPDGGDFLCPDQSRIDFVRAWNRSEKHARLMFSTPARYFAELRRKKTRLPIRHDDLNPVHEGCWSTRIRLKQYNRRLEETAADLEMLENLTGAGQAGSGELWETIVWNAFHDIICGSLVKKAVLEALALYAAAERAALRHTTALLRQLARPHLRRAAGKCHMLFNSLPYPRREIVALPNAGGFAAADLPPAGYVFMCDSNAKALPKLRASSAGDQVQVRQNGRVMENALVRVQFAENGAINGLFDKQHGHELALADDGMNTFLHQPDHGDPWLVNQAPANGALLRVAPIDDPRPMSGAGLDRVNRNAIKAADADCFAYPAPVLIHRHPLQATIEFPYPAIGWTTRVTLRAGEKLVRFHTTFIPHGKKYRLRVAFPTAIFNGKIRHSTPCGYITRPAGEYAAQGWLDYADRQKGLLLLNRGLPGNNVTGNVMMLSLFRAISLDAHENNPWYEEGIPQVFEYAIMPFRPGDPAYQPARIAAIFNRPPLLLTFANAAPRRPEPPVWAASIELQGHPAELTCLQRAGRHMRVRLWESAGQAGVTRLTLPGVTHCRRTDATGATLPARITRAGNIISIPLKPFEIVTLDFLQTRKNAH